MGNKTQQKYFILAGSFVSVIMLLLYGFGHVSVKTCSQVIPVLLMSCAGLLNLGIELGTSLLLAFAAAVLLKRIKVRKSVLISVFALLFLWELKSLIFWSGTFWVSCVVDIIVAIVLFFIMDTYFNRWQAKTWVKVSIASLLFCFLFIFVPLLQIQIDRQLMMMAY